MSNTAGFGNTATRCKLDRDRLGPEGVRAYMLVVGDLENEQTTPVAPSLCEARLERKKRCQQVYLRLYGGAEPYTRPNLVG